MFQGKDERVRFRITKDEKEKLKIAATKQNLTMSEYIRRIIISPPPITHKDYEDITYRLLYELRKIGVNINQIAKKYNEHKYIQPQEELLRKMDRIDGLTKEILSILQKEG